MGSNHRMSESKSDALPLGEPPNEKQDAFLLSQITSLEYKFAERILKMAEVDGFEPSNPFLDQTVFKTVPLS
jgi:hypothetical protein